jgi:hypothetical protein
MFKTLRVSNINSNYYDNTDERYTTSHDLTGQGPGQDLTWRGLGAPLAGRAGPRQTVDGNDGASCGRGGTVVV